MSNSPKTIRVAFGASCRINDYGTTWRERLARAVRRLADRIDGQVSVRMATRTVPEISYQQRVECVEYGLRMVHQCLLLTAKQEAQERAFRATHRELF